MAAWRIQFAPHRAYISDINGIRRSRFRSASAPNDRSRNNNCVRHGEIKERSASDCCPRTRLSKLVLNSPWQCGQEETMHY